MSSGDTLNELLGLSRSYGVKIKKNQKNPKKPLISIVYNGIFHRI
jgi:hypothetical protein